MDDQPDGFKRTAAVYEARGQRRQAAAAAAFHMERDPQRGHEPAQHYLEKARVLEAQTESTDAPSSTDP